MRQRRSVPITVIVPERQGVELLQRCAADPTVMLLATGETLAAAGLLGLLRVGRAMVIAPDVASRTSGCECCQVRLDLVDAVRHATLHRTPPSRLVVVVDRVDTASSSAAVDDTTLDDPAADVVTAISTVHASGELERLAHLGGLAVEVDARAAATRLASGLALWNGQIEAALAIADSIVVTRSELVTEQARSALASSLDSVNRIGAVSFCRATDVVVARLMALDAWSRSPEPDRSPARNGMASPSWPDDSSPRSAVETVVLCRAGVLDPVATEAWLDRITAASPSGLLRFHATLRVSPEQSRVCIRGSRSAMRSTPESPSSSPRSTDTPSENGNVVVLIGRGLDRHALHESFESIEMAP